MHRQQHSSKSHRARGRLFQLFRRQAGRESILAFCLHAEKHDPRHRKGTFYPFSRLSEERVQCSHASGIALDSGLVIGANKLDLFVLLTCRRTPTHKRESGHIFGGYCCTAVDILVRFCTFLSCTHATTAESFTITTSTTSIRREYYSMDAVAVSRLRLRAKLSNRNTCVDVHRSALIRVQKLLPSKHLTPRATDQPTLDTLQCTLPSAFVKPGAPPQLSGQASREQTKCLG